MESCDYEADAQQRYATQCGQFSACLIAQAGTLVTLVCDSDAYLSSLLPAVEIGIELATPELTSPKNSAKRA